ncbi:hypothetical protein SERLA73DRAFT_181916 [Serpula lacrymans var. lacrymans S7.3]|uniref:Translocon-associated protein subunit alpha n=2 Tax=Serpula lacrymans var. lacrymans TaxID=341189 RepID=F8PYY7_SERL3|nr:uncharacterized protein SERLADRAFT_468333 [Serpula lacrymans var. lacrymans S7.9]EGN99100.1 hypothetical protein SERLA73DRAFT_181916 [Serpula lacrymans var. lacrymans S7.3]EGO24670.1 hypothetical protein SERLADRAFT_468333 [Serpula lacrymans var. lacrymans S7.9]
MRLLSIIGSSVTLAAWLLSASAATLETTDTVEPEILIEAAFPENNPFGHVVNGERNQIILVVENKSERNVTITTVAGSFHNPDTNTLIKNSTSLQYDLRLLEGSKLQIPYTFHSEFKPGDLRLNVWLEHVVDDEKYRVTAYDSVVTVVEPEISFFDFKLISTYLVVLGLLGGASYFAYQTYMPQTKKSRRKTRPSPSEVSAPVGAVTASGGGGYQEEWIPEHHLKKTRAGKGKKGVASSADEMSGNESASKRKSRK